MHTNSGGAKPKSEDEDKQLKKDASFVIAKSQM